MLKHDLMALLSEASVKKCSSKPLFLTPRRQTKITSAAPGHGKFAITLKGPEICLKLTIIVCSGQTDIPMIIIIR